MNLFRLFGEIAIDGTQANRTLDNIAQRAGMTTQEVESHFNKIGTVAGNIMRGIGIVGAAVGGAFLAVTEGTREYRAQMGLLDGAFQAAGHSSAEAKNTYSELNAVLGDTEQAVEAAQHIAQIADNEKEMNTLTDIGTGVFQRFGQSLPLEGLYEGILHTSQLGEVQGSLADALEWSGITVEDFNKQLEKCTTSEERQDLIMKTLKDTYGEAATQYQATNKDVMEARKAQERLTDTMAELGRVAEPIVTAIKNKIADMAAVAIPHIENLVGKVKDMRKWIKDNKNTVDAWKAGIIAASVSVGSFLLVMNWGRIVGAATTAIKTARAAVILFNAALRANPIGFVISLLAGLVAGFIYLWNNNKSFRQFWLDMWAKLKSACGTAVDWMKNKLNAMKDAAGNVKKWFSDMGKSISDKLESAQKAVGKVVDKIKGFFPLKIGKIFSNIKIPKITVSGGKAPYGIGGAGALPSFKVAWHAKGAVFSEPTILNSRLGLQGVGDSSTPEAVAPIGVLQSYVRQAVRAEMDNSAVGRIIIEQTTLLLDYLKRAMPKGVYLDGNLLVGELMPAIDEGLSSRYLNVRRGNVR